MLEAMADLNNDGSSKADMMKLARDEVGAMPIMN
jgi:hypothetical protein